MASLSKGYTFGATETVTNAKLSSLVDDASISGIVNADVAAGAAIASSKVNYTGSGIATNAATQTWTGANTYSGNVILGTTNQGDIWYDNGTKTTRLTPGTSGQVLQTQGDGANPQWAAVGTAGMPAGTVVQVVNVQDGTVDTGSTAVPYDNTIPVKTEGDEYMTLAITPTSATNKLKIDVVFIGSNNSSADNITVMLLQDTTTNALACGATTSSAAGAAEVIGFTHYMTAGTASETTFKVNAGMSGGSTLTFNGAAGTVLFGNTMASSITIQEIQV